MRKLISVLALTGCAASPNPQWVKPGASGNDLAMDRGQCQAQAFSVPNASTMQVGLVFNSCMRGKGWVLVQ